MIEKRRELYSNLYLLMSIAVEKGNMGFEPHEIKKKKKH